MHFGNLLNIKNFATVAKRFASTNVIEHLKDRSLIKVSGDDAAVYLQGLITNDIKHLENGPGAMYSMFLNNRGRVIADTLIFRQEQANNYFVECDNSILESLMVHLKRFRVRRQISVESLASSKNIYVVFDKNLIHNQKAELDEETTETIKPPDSLSSIIGTKNSVKIYRDLIIYKDPRISDLGLRVIIPSSIKVLEQLSQIMEIKQTASPHTTYRKLRYSLGVGEGVEDIPTGQSFPLECNADYLHGVSFHKGCYIGQELTARTHHTGVVRKRLMPLIFSCVPLTLPEENKISVNGVNIGKFRGIEQNTGLGLLRINEALDCFQIPIGNGVATTFKPKWWPVEVSKEKISAQKI